MSFKDYIKEDKYLSILGISELKDDLELSDIQKNPKWHWIIQAGIKNAVIGKKGNKLVWYSGVWVLGKFDETNAIWKSGIWKGGTSADGSFHGNGDSPDKWK